MRGACTDRARAVRASAALDVFAIKALRGCGRPPVVCPATRDVPCARHCEFLELDSREPVRGSAHCPGCGVAVGAAGEVQASNVMPCANRCSTTDNISRAIPG